MTTDALYDCRRSGRFVERTVAAPTENGKRRAEPVAYPKKRRGTARVTSSGKSASCPARNDEWY